MPFLAWAPVSPERRLPEGALMEMWVQGVGEVRIPLPQGVASARLFHAVAQPGRLGRAADSAVREGHLVFEAASPGGRRHGYVMPG
jgi:hypothetical protein